MLCFTADSVLVRDDFEGTFLVGLSSSDGRAQAIHFRRPHRTAGDELRTAVRNDWMYYDEAGIQRGAFGRILRVELRQDRLNVTVEDAMHALLGHREFQVQFKLSDEDFELLRAGLRVQFAGSDRFIDNTFRP